MMVAKHSIETKAQRGYLVLYNSVASLLYEAMTLHSSMFVKYL